MLVHVTFKRETIFSSLAVQNGGDYIMGLIDSDGKWHRKKWLICLRVDTNSILLFSKYFEACSRMHHFLPDTRQTNKKKKKKKKREKTNWFYVFSKTCFQCTGCDQNILWLTFCFPRHKWTVSEAIFFFKIIRFPSRLILVNLHWSKHLTLPIWYDEVCSFLFVFWFLFFSIINVLIC